MWSLIEKLEHAIRDAGVQIEGVSIADPNDRRTWRVTPRSQQGAAQPVIDTFDPNDAAIIAAEKDVRAERIDRDLSVQAVARVAWEEGQKCMPQLGQTLLTWDQFLARVKAVYRGSL